MISGRHPGVGGQYGVGVRGRERKREGQKRPGKESGWIFLKRRQNEHQEARQVSPELTNHFGVLLKNPILELDLW
jgi:hypothetical protein